MIPYKLKVLGIRGSWTMLDILNSSLKIALMPFGSIALLYSTALSSRRHAAKLALQHVGRHVLITYGSPGGCGTMPLLMYKVCCRLNASSKGNQVFLVGGVILVFSVGLECNENSKRNHTVCAKGQVAPVLFSPMGAWVKQLFLFDPLASRWRWRKRGAAYS